ncbi:Uncharacterized protein LHYA1_G002858 [Lachnellula hyalina]|uniref:Uncharacterized protein n=1 Tax=Lachnellula hyalina TaxID=1316788 RepID=A0A8H8R4S3_9HELO|nr:Uncharacterized protein LHYA1_G002858 [Lachnellula hyalina]TVY28428.1 Uncharacterized protein LHYA1_G002858 [Lachnellula hyalina]
MNSSRHTNRPTNRSRGRGGRSRGGFNDRNSSSLGSDYKPVPTTQQVIPGAPVSIVLKVDQPTGTEVQGIVAELLTRGDHPRGIKVRLRDGRVGRVQRMVSRETAEAGAEGMTGLGRNGELGNGGHESVRVASPGVAGPRYRDFRVEAPDEPDVANLSLADYVVVKSNKKKGKSKKLDEEKSNEAVPDEDTEDLASTIAATSTCPVCGEFEGDEVAVAHHVNEHFD